MARASRSAIVFINKLEAARRQIDAAIRMTFANEDEIAVHTVVAAGYRILREILESRGRHDVEDILRLGVYEMAKALAHNELNEKEINAIQFPEAPWFFEMVFALAGAIRENGDAVTPDDVPAFLGEKGKREHYQAMSKAANFLKHADRDPNAMLSLTDVNNSEIIFHAAAAYNLVNPGKLTHEMLVYNMYYASELGQIETLPTNQHEFAKRLSKYSPAKRRIAYARLIRLSKKRSLQNGL